MTNLLSKTSLNALKDKVWMDNDNSNVNTTERLISIATGAIIFYKALSNISRHPLIALQEAAVGGVLLYRGATGVCPIYNKMGKDSTDVEAITIGERFIVNTPREEVYAFWRKLENLPRFMKHIASVEEKNDKLSHWSANVPGELVKISWNAEITREEGNRYIGWHSVQGSMIDNAGKVEFNDASDGSGTELYVEISYFPPAGHLGRGIASLFNGVFKNMIREDVINFKHYVEGEDYKTYSSSQKQIV
ncbi:MAG TPA: YgaP-like transmembrane domain [Sphingobacteriaceae bacterium]|nr:YgaP-like transmembrane domain [Sphingobacteriaceae bacterium]